VWWSSGRIEAVVHGSARSHGRIRGWLALESGLGFGLEVMATRRGIVTANRGQMGTTFIMRITFIIHGIRLLRRITRRIHHTFHGLVAGIAKTAGTRSPAGTAPLSLVVSGERVAPCKASVALWAHVRSLPGVELGVSLEVVETTEARVAGLTDVWFLVAVRE
jgi:hypothetical protein